MPELSGGHSFETLPGFGEGGASEDVVGSEDSTVGSDGYVDSTVGSDGSIDSIVETVGLCSFPFSELSSVVTSFSFLQFAFSGKSQICNIQ